MLDALYERARIRCHLKLLMGSDLGIYCLDRLLEFGGSITASFEG